MHVVWHAAALCRTDPLSCGPTRRACYAEGDGEKRPQKRMVAGCGARLSALVATRMPATALLFRMFVALRPPTAVSYDAASYCRSLTHQTCFHTLADWTSKLMCTHEHRRSAHPAHTHFQRRYATRECAWPTGCPIRGGNIGLHIYRVSPQLPSQTTTTPDWHCALGSTLRDTTDCHRP